MKYNTVIRLITTLAVSTSILLPLVTHAATTYPKSIPLTSVMTPATLDRVQEVFVDCTQLLPKLADVDSLENEAEVDALIRDKSIQLVPTDRVFEGITKEDFIRLKVIGCHILSNARSEQKARMVAGTEDGVSLVKSTDSVTGHFNKYFFRVTVKDNKFKVYPTINANNFNPSNGLHIQNNKQGISRLINDGTNVYVETGAFTPAAKYYRVRGLNGAELKTASNDFSLITFVWDSQGVFVISNNRLYKVVGALGSSFSADDQFFRYAKDSKRTYVYVDKEKKLYAAPFVAHLSEDKNQPGLVFEDATHEYYVVPTKRVVVINKTVYQKVGSTVYKDKTRVYNLNLFNGNFNVVGGADAATFGMQPGSYDGRIFTDKNRTYILKSDSNLLVLNLLSKAVQFADENRGSGNYWFHTTKGTYFTSGGYNHWYDVSPVRVGNTDVGTFIVLYDTPWLSVSKDKNKVYALYQNKVVILPADAKSFEMVMVGGGLAYGKDKNKVFVATRKDYKPYALLGADPNTFRVVNSGGWYYFGVDATHVWFYDNDTDKINLIPNAKPENFNFDNYVKNKTILNNVAVAESVEMSSLRTVSPCFVVDATNVWVKNSAGSSLVKLDGADPNTISYNGNFIHDKNSVWTGNCYNDRQFQKNASIDGGSISIVASNLFMDKNDLWFYDEKNATFVSLSSEASIDRSSLSVVTGGDGTNYKAVLKDKSRVWLYELSSGGAANLNYEDAVDTASFNKLFPDSNFFYKDKNTVFGLDWGCNQWKDGSYVGGSLYLASISGAISMGATLQWPNASDSCMPELNSQGSIFSFNFNTKTFEKK